MNRLTLALAGAFVMATCGGTGDVGEIPELPPVTPEELQQLLAESEQPLVLNVWASWCIPCRSEAPLLRAAHASFGGLGPPYQPEFGCRL